MPRCCGGATCACSILPGTHMQVAGTGSASDPFVITADLDLRGDPNSVFTVTLDGNGTTLSPWHISVGYSASAKLDDVPDVNAPAPTNGQVLGWDTATGKWTPREPTTAAAGSVDTDTSLTGDGSSGDPLAVVADPDDYLDTTADGVGVNEDGKNQMVLHYANDATRAVSPVTPQLNSLSMLDSLPGVTWYWTGTQWLIVTNGIARNFGDPDDVLLQMSGTFPGLISTQMIRQIDTITNADGTFDVLSSTDLDGAAGVLSCVFQETGPVPFKAMLSTNVNSIIGTAYRLDDGSAYGSQAITGVAVAYTY